VLIQDRTAIFLPERISGAGAYPTFQKFIKFTFWEMGVKWLKRRGFEKGCFTI
jgi:hypothetical protein